MKTTYQALTIADTAVGLAAATTDPTGHQQMQYGLGRLETADVRYRMDGTAPTSTEGVLLATGSLIELNGHDALKRIKFIRTGSSAVLRIHCWPVKPISVTP
jgi:acyl-coenzyme A thioesterase PaaI-like protein